MRKYITSAVISLLAGIGAVQVIHWGNAALAYALTRWGGWQAAEAAQAAPVILFALAAGLALSLWGLHEDNKRYRRTGYGRIKGYSARQKSSTDDKEIGA